MLGILYKEKVSFPGTANWKHSLAAFMIPTLKTPGWVFVVWAFFFFNLGNNPLNEIFISFLTLQVPFSGPQLFVLTSGHKG